MKKFLMPIQNRRMKNLAIIPARGGSKRFPGKNIKNLGELPLIVHSILYAQQNKDIIHQVVVSTDNEEIKKIALTYGVIIIDRPSEISGDLTTTIEVMQHALKMLGENYDHVILLQPTNPLRPKNLLRNAMTMCQNEKFDSLMTVTLNEHKLGKIVKNKFIPYTYKLGQRSQDLERFYYENGLLYIMKTSEIMKGNILGENHYPLVMNHPFSKIDIDTLEDFELAEYYHQKYKNE
jgi:N-acylneuraminate cytidylyltransferase